MLQLLERFHRLVCATLSSLRQGGGTRRKSQGSRCRRELGGSRCWRVAAGLLNGSNQALNGIGKCHAHGLVLPGQLLPDGVPQLPVSMAILLLKTTMECTQALKVFPHQFILGSPVPAGLAGSGGWRGSCWTHWVCLNYMPLSSEACSLDTATMLTAGPVVKISEKGSHSRRHCV